MTKSNKKVFFTAFSVISVLLALVAGLGAVFCTIMYYEPDIAFFTRDARGAELLLGITAALSAIYLIAGFVMNFTKSEELYEKPRFTGATLYSGLLAGFSLISADVLFILDLYRNGTPIRFESASDVITAAVVILAVPAALYFFSVAFGTSERSGVTSVLGMFMILWSAAFLLKIYFNMNLSLNSPPRVLTQMVSIAFMCYFIQELRFRLGQPRPALFHAFSAVAVLLVFVSGGIEIVSAVKYGTTDADRAFKFAELCIGIYILFNTFHLPSAVTDNSPCGKQVLKERKLMREEDDDSYLEGLADDDLAIVREPLVSYEKNIASEYTPDVFSRTAETEVATEETAEDTTAEGSSVQAEDVCEIALDERQKESAIETETVSGAAEYAKKKTTEPEQKESEPKEAAPVREPISGEHRAEIKKELSASAARRTESFISRVLEEEAKQESENDEFDTSCSMEESPDFDDEENE